MQISARQLIGLLAMCAAVFGQDDSTRNHRTAAMPEPVAVNGRSQIVRQSPRKSGIKARPKALASSPQSAAPGIAFLGSVSTPSPAGSFAPNGNLAYVCNANDVSVADVPQPLNLR